MLVPLGSKLFTLVFNLTWNENWLIDWLINWLINWLIDWLIDWLIVPSSNPRHFPHSLSSMMSSPLASQFLRNLAVHFSCVFSIAVNSMISSASRRLRRNHASLMSPSIKCQCHSTDLLWEASSSQNCQITGNTRRLASRSADANIRLAAAFRSSRLACWTDLQCESKGKTNSEDSPSPPWRERTSGTSFWGTLPTPSLHKYRELWKVKITLVRLYIIRV